MLSNHYPTVDVIIPAYNAERFIGETIQSVLAQTYLPRKIIIVNDGSVDSTVEVIQNFKSEIIEIISVENGGISYARNIGIRASKADYVAFLDADDLWEPDKLKAQVEALIANPKAKVVYSYAIMVDEEGIYDETAYSYNNKPYPSGKLFETILFDWIIPSGSSSSVMVESELVKSVGMFDEDLRYREDVDLWLRLAKRTDFVLVAKEHVRIRIYPKSHTRLKSWKKTRQEIIEIFYYMNKYAKDHKFPNYTLHWMRELFISPFFSPRYFHKVFEFPTFYLHIRRNALYFSQQVFGDKFTFGTFFLLVKAVVKKITRKAKQLI